MVDPAAPLIRHATPSDLPAVSQFLTPFVARRQLLPRDEEELARLMRNGFLAEVEGRLVGFAAVEIYSKKLAEIQCLAVSEEVQRKGIGRELIRRCVQCSRDHGVLELMAISASEDFLRSCGFDYSLPDQKRALFIRTRDDD